MADKIATNTFDGGLNLDLNPLVAPNNVLSNCLNGTFLTFNGLDNTLQNDMGNAAIKTKTGDKVSLKEGYVPVGMTSFGGIIYIASHNPISGDNEIGSFPSPDWSPDNYSEENGSYINGELDFDELTSNGNYTINLKGVNNDNIIMFKGDYISFIGDDKLGFTDNELIKNLIKDGIITYTYVCGGEELTPENSNGYEIKEYTDDEGNTLYTSENGDTTVVRLRYNGETTSNLQIIVVWNSPVELVMQYDIVNKNGQSVLLFRPVLFNKLGTEPNLTKFENGSFSVDIRGITDDTIEDFDNYPLLQHINSVGLNKLSNGTFPYWAILTSGIYGIKIQVYVKISSKFGDELPIMYRDTAIIEGINEEGNATSLHNSKYITHTYKYSGNTQTIDWKYVEIKSLTLPTNRYNIAQSNVEIGNPTTVPTITQTLGEVTGTLPGGIKIYRPILNKQNDDGEFIIQTLYNQNPDYYELDYPDFADLNRNYSFTYNELTVSQVTYDSDGTYNNFDPVDIMLKIKIGKLTKFNFRVNLTTNLFPVISGDQSILDYIPYNTEDLYIVLSHDELLKFQSNDFGDGDTSVIKYSPTKELNLNSYQLTPFLQLLSINKENVFRPFAARWYRGACHRSQHWGELEVSSITQNSAERTVNKSEYFFNSINNLGGYVQIPNGPKVEFLLDSDRSTLTYGVAGYPTYRCESEKGKWNEIVTKLNGESVTISSDYYTFIIDLLGIAPSKYKTIYLERKTTYDDDGNILEDGFTSAGFSYVDSSSLESQVSSYDTNYEKFTKEDGRVDFYYSLSDVKNFIYDASKFEDLSSLILVMGSVDTNYEIESNQPYSGNFIIQNGGGSAIIWRAEDGSNFVACVNKDGNTSTINWSSTNGTFNVNGNPIENIFSNIYIPYTRQFTLQEYQIDDMVLGNYSDNKYDIPINLTDKSIYAKTKCKDVHRFRKHILLLSGNQELYQTKNVTSVLKEKWTSENFLKYFNEQLQENYDEYSNGTGTIYANMIDGVIRSVDAKGSFFTAECVYERQSDGTFLPSDNYNYITFNGKPSCYPKTDLYGEAKDFYVKDGDSHPTYVFISDIQTIASL